MTIRFLRFLILVWLAVGGTAVPSSAAEGIRPELATRLTAGGGIVLDFPEVPGSVLRLEASSALSGWEEIGRFHDAIRSYPDLEDPRVRRFYRVRAAERGPDDDWKNQIVFPSESFLSAGDGGSARWVKFVILTSDPHRVYYQDTAKYPFHFDFAKARLAPFAGMDPAAFDAVTLRRGGRKAVLGTVIFPPGPGFQEFGVQIAGQDVWTPQEVIGWLNAVRATVHGAGPLTVCYVPAFEQREAAFGNEPVFAEAGYVLASLDRWSRNVHRYSSGWALGTLKYIPAAEIPAAFADGRLLPEDILLTDGVPAETPLVAGIISLTPSTPNSHTAILAQSFGVPFVHLPDPDERARVQSLAGRKVILRAGGGPQPGPIKALDVSGILSPQDEAALLALKNPPPLQYTPKAVRGALSESVEKLTPAEIRHFGGKAVNFGFLRRAIPDNCPEAVALSFDLWDAFLDQPLSGGGTLREAIAGRLAPHSQYPPQIGPLRTALAEIRDLITDVARFSPQQQEAVLDALAGFDPERKIRFRSSTNVEDSETFTGAGLYDSYSGCLADDLDPDESGPCRCDSEEPRERGVFRAIAKVYASFYNENAYLERLRRGVKEDEVGMAVLAHHSFPDEEELANGVATLDCRFEFARMMSGTMVTQKGAESVTNPEGGALPEIVEVSTYNEGSDLLLRQHSSRVPLGAAVMDWDRDYRGFLPLFQSVANAWHEYYTAKPSFQLDFEYKKDVRLGLVIKQVREIPRAGDGGAVTAYLIDEPVEWVVAQKEFGDVFSNHRLKSLWNLRSMTGSLAESATAAGLYLSGRTDYLEDGTVATLDGPMSARPGAGVSADGLTQRWVTGSGASRREWSLTTEAERTVSGVRPPVFTAGEFPVHLTVTYPSPVPALDWDGRHIQRNTDTVALEPRRRRTPGSILVERSIDNGAGIVVTTSFYWPDEERGAAGYTAPVVEFVRTEICGLTTRPVVLTNYWSQTCRPGHHNFTEEFIFEPRLDPGVDAETLQELQAADIRYIHVEWGRSPVVVTAAGLDGRLRRL